MLTKEVSPRDMGDSELEMQIFFVGTSETLALAGNAELGFESFLIAELDQEQDTCTHYGKWLIFKIG